MRKIIAASCFMGIFLCYAMENSHDNFIPDSLFTQNSVVAPTNDNDHHHHVNPPLVQVPHCDVLAKILGSNGFSSLVIQTNLVKTIAGQKMFPDMVKATVQETVSHPWISPATTKDAQHIEKIVALILQHSFE